MPPSSSYTIELVCNGFALVRQLITILTGRLPIRTNVITKWTGIFFLLILRLLTNILQSRLCVNCVISENYSLPLVISTFVDDLYGTYTPLKIKEITLLLGGFRLLNLKNDNLRKRFDGIKYDVKKIEEVVYDISVRGLVKKGDS